MSSPLRYEVLSGESAGKRMPGVGKDKYSTEFGILGASSVLVSSMKTVGASLSAIQRACVAANFPVSRSAI